MPLACPGKSRPTSRTSSRTSTPGRTAPWPPYARSTRPPYGAGPSRRRHAIALDKNYIDTADTRIVQPAVDWYDRHGSPEERLKAYYYLGVCHFNGKRYNQAIVAYTIAEGLSKESNNYKLLGLINTGLADTFTKTKEHSRSTEYIDKSIDYFSKCGIKDYVNHQRYRKAQNMVNLNKWDEALASYKHLLSDPSVESPLRESVKANYAMTLITSPHPDIHNSLRLFKEVLSKNGVLENRNQEGAYAFALQYCGYDQEAKIAFDKMTGNNRQGDVYYNYWKHRAALSEKQFEKAFLFLKDAMSQSDSISMAAHALSVSLDRDEFLSKEFANKSLALENSRKQVVIILLLLLLSISSTILIFLRLHSKQKEKRDQLAATINAYEDEVKNLEAEKDIQKNTIRKLGKKINKARFAFIQDIYMAVKNNGDNSPENIAKHIMEKVQELHTGFEHQEAFESLLDKECNEIVRRFKVEFPSLTDDEYRLASYLFAGFNNSFITLMMNRVSQDSIRMAKSRLKKKIASSTSNMKEEFLEYF